MEKANKKQVLLFYCVEAEAVARKVAAESPFITLQSINWRYQLVSPYVFFAKFLHLFHLGRLYALLPYLRFITNFFISVFCLM